MSTFKKSLVSLVAFSMLIASGLAFAVKPSDRFTLVDLADFAANDLGEFTTLYDLVSDSEFSGIAAALDGNGQFTVFAPTDEAFGKLNTMLNDAFCYSDVFALADAQPAYVADVLLYHVARGRMDSGEVLPKEQIRMLSGDRLTREPFSLDLVDVLTRTATIDAENWLDVEADNGILHGIKDVVLPYAPQSNCAP
jgi:uncharacterized surface protein with fasciclin (FAS1) repeats